jgi:hypothetical protein
VSVAATKEEFEKAAAGLPFKHELDFDAEVVCIEPITGAYFRDSSRQRCIIRTKSGKLFVASYD